MIGITRLLTYREGTDALDTQAVSCCIFTARAECNRRKFMSYRRLRNRRTHVANVNIACSNPFAHLGQTTCLSRLRRVRNDTPPIASKGNAPGAGTPRYW